MSQPPFKGDNGRWVLLACEFVKYTHTQQHHQQPDRHNHQQRETEPAQDHGRRSHAALYASIAKVLRDNGCTDRSRVLPQHGHEHEDGGDEDDREGDLADGPGREGLDVDFGARGLVLLVVPAGECGEEEEGEEGEDDGHDSGTSES